MENKEQLKNELLYLAFYGERTQKVENRIDEINSLLRGK